MTIPDQPELQGTSIVALGAFNPAIFQPLWFSGNDLIREEEARNASVEIIHRNVTSFSTEWFSLQITEEKFAVETNDPTKNLPLRDLVAETFQILEHTPINAFGFNSHKHYKMPSEPQWHAVGDHYAPKEPWQEILAEPKLRSLTIQGKRENCEADRIQVKIEPSGKVELGVFIHFNEHYRLRNEGKEFSQKKSIEEFLKTLTNSWDSFLSFSDQSSKHLLMQV